MITAEIILDKRRKAKKGYPVKIRVYDSISAKNNLNSRTYINLNIYQDNENLKYTSDLKRRELDLIDQVEYCNNNHLNLEESLRIITDGIPHDDIDMEIAILEKKLEVLKRKKGIIKESMLIEFIGTLIKEKSIYGRPIRSYSLLIPRIYEFTNNKDIAINSITKEWLNDFDIYYKTRKLKDTSISTYISLLKSIYKEAQSRESLYVKPDNPFSKLRVFNKDKKSIDVTIDDIIKLHDITLDQFKRGDKRRSLFVSKLVLFQFAIGGHDLIDIAVLEWDNIRDNRIVFKRFKNRFKASQGEYVDNMLNDFAKDFIKEFGDKNSKRIFTMLPDPREDIKKYNNTQVTINTSFYKKIGALAGIENKITSKTTRYLFRTAAGNLLIDSLVIMKLQGHTPKGVTFGYQGNLNHEVQDKEHQKILDLVFK